MRIRLAFTGAVNQALRSNQKSSHIFNEMMGENFPTLFEKTGLSNLQAENVQVEAARKAESTRRGNFDA